VVGRPDRASGRNGQAPLDDVLSAQRTAHRGRLKDRLVAAGVKERRCERCGLDSWRGLPLSLQLHHVNGCSDDNRLENLMLLCPNCHSQTRTHSRKRTRRV
jgi:hypothetical protein